MWSQLKLFGLVLPCFLVLDLIWLGVVMASFYDQEIGTLARRENGHLSPRWSAAWLVYLLIPGGLVLFVKPLLGAGSSAGTAFAWGAVFGLVLYGVYDLTNRAILEHWPLRMTIVDILWGMTLCGTVSVIMQWIDARFIRV